MTKNEKRKNGEKQIEIPFTKLAAFGAGVSSLVPEFRTVTQSMGANDLYRVSFPNGITGELAKFKDGSGNLGTIIKDGKFVGQARWNKAEPITSTTTLPYNPQALFMAAALMGIEKKLGQIEETGQEILQFLENQKESQMTGDLNILTDIINNYKYNWGDKTYKKNKDVLVQNIMRKAAENIEFYQRQITEVTEKKSFIHREADTNKIMKKIETYFKNYQLSLYIYAFAYFLDIMLLENFNEEYLENIIKRLENYSYNYRMLYTECYDKMEQLSQTSLEKQVIKGVANTSKFLGNTVAKIPVIKRGPVDEALIGVGKQLKEHKKQKTEKTMERYRKNRDSGIVVFIENIRLLSQLYNQPIEVLADQDKLCIQMNV